MLGLVLGPVSCLERIIQLLAGSHTNTHARTHTHTHTHTDREKGITHQANIWHKGVKTKQNSLWLTHKQLHLLIFLTFKSHLLFDPGCPGLHPRNVWELWNYDCIGCVCGCNWVLRLSAGQGPFPPHRASGLCTFWEHQTWPTCQKSVFSSLASALHLTFKLIHKHLTIHLKPDRPAQALYPTFDLTAVISSGLQMRVWWWQKGEKSILCLQPYSYLFSLGCGSAVWSWREEVWV